MSAVTDISGFNNEPTPAQERAMINLVRIVYEYIDGFHIFSCPAYPDCTVGDPDFNTAKAAVEPELEKYFTATHKKLCFTLAPWNESPANTVLH